jgi:hypothetical protein
MFLYLPVKLDFYLMNLYNKHMNDTNQDTLEPVNVDKLFTEFSDTSLAELMLTVKELREKLEYEQKLVAAKEFKLTKAEELIETLEGRINSVTTILAGESDVCIDCEAVKEQEDKE